MAEEKKTMDFSQLKDTDPIFTYEQDEEAELAELNSTWDNVKHTLRRARWR